MASLKLIVAVLLINLLFIVPTFADSVSIGKPCCYGDKYIPAGDVVANFPGHCMQLYCNGNNTEPRYYDSQENCGCCEFDGKMYKNGQRIAGICTDILCKNGNWVTKGYFDECCKKCNLKNDPHITTFDGYYYHWQGHCNYSISQLNNGYNETFGIYGDFKVCRIKGTCIDKTTFTDNPNTVIEVSYNLGADVKVNDADYVVKAFIEAVNVGGFHHPVLAWRSGACNMFLGSQGYLLMACENEINVWAYPNLINDVNGLCGHYNMYQTDDFTNRMGVQRPLVPYPFAFPNSWKTSDQSEASCQGSGTGNVVEGDVCKATEEERKEFKHICKSLLEDICWEDHTATGFTLKVAIWSCVSDLCIMTQNGETEVAIDEWKEEMINILKDNIEIEVKTTVGAKPPHGPDCDDGCGHDSFQVKHSVNIVIGSKGGE